MIFYLGTHKPHWLWRTTTPLFLSRRRLVERKALKPSFGPWALDSGGFTELQLHGHWTVSAKQYAQEAEEWVDRIGSMKWAAIQDWMCEPFMIEKTGLTIRHHQERTIASYLELTSLSQKVNFIPIIQGFAIDDYFHCVELYQSSGIDLTKADIVGVGSICRRQGTNEAAEILNKLAGLGLKIHGFGLKTAALTGPASKALASADSMAWSYGARYKPPLPGCPHKTCANCLKWAENWRRKILESLSA